MSQSQNNIDTLPSSRACIKKNNKVTVIVSEC